MSDLAKMRAQRSKEMEVPISLTSFKMNCDQRLAVQKVMVIKNLRQAVKAKRQLYGGQIGNMGDIFKAMDKDGGGTIDTFEFRDGVSRLGLGLSEPQIQEMIECFDEDGNGEIEYEEFMSLVNAPIIDVSAIARIEWENAKAKAEAEEQKLKNKAYSVAVAEAEAASAVLEKQAAARLAQLEKKKLMKEQRRAKEAAQRSKDYRRKSRDGLQRRKTQHEKRDTRRLAMLLPVLEGRRRVREESKADWSRAQAEEAARQRVMQQRAWERGAAEVRRQTMRRARRKADMRVAEKWNQSIHESMVNRLEPANRRPASVAW